MTYRPLYSTLPTSMRDDTASIIAECITSSKQTTRKEIASRANISVMSVSKAITALFDSGIITERQMRDASTHRNSGHISLFVHNNFIIFDISDTSGCAYCLDGEYEIVYKYSYQYQSILNHLDNTRIFVERAYSALCDNIHTYSGMCVILNNTQISKDEISNYIHTCFKHTPNLIVTFEDAVKSIRSTALHQNLPTDKLFYLNIGYSCQAYFLSSNFTLRCNPQKLVGKSNRTVGSALEELISPSELMSIVFDVFNCAQAMLDPDLFILESDRFILGSNSAFNLSRKLKSYFSDSHRLIVSDKRPHYYVKGGMSLLVRHVIANILSPKGR